MKQKILFILFFIFLVGYAYGQTNITDSLLHQNYQRKFMVHLPPGFTAFTKRALVVSLHGGSGTMVNAQGFSQLNPVSDEHNFVVAWPQGYGIAPPGFSWADGRNTSADQAGIDDVGFIDKLITTLVSRYSIDTNRIYICGFSNGGFMVQRIACQMPKRFAAMASLGSSMDTVLFRNCSPVKPVPMAFFNGTSDPAMPYAGGSMQNPFVIPVVPVDTTVRFWVKHNKCLTTEPVFNFPDSFTTDNSTAELYVYSRCDCDAEVKFYKLINGGHTWPGVYVAAQAAVLGNTNRDIHASVELWKFFSTHTLCQSSVGIKSSANNRDMLIYPNPANSLLHIAMQQDEHFEVIISNVTGQIFFSSINSTLVDLTPFVSGVYYVTVKSGSGIQVSRIIKL